MQGAFLFFKNIDMKKLIKTSIFFFAFVFTIHAQQEKGIIGADNWLDNWTNFRSSKTDYSQPSKTLKGKISTDTKLFKSETYLLEGKVYVTNNAVLSIEPGTVILGDSEGTLIITRGASIMAVGKQTDPIVFTSSKEVKSAGDWGGIIILGDAPINKFGNSSSIYLDLDPSLTGYGGTNEQGNAGALKFVRIEYAGRKTTPSGNLSGLLVAGVGLATDFKNVMVSFSAGDSFTAYGGKFRGSKLISYKCINDDYNFTQGVEVVLYNSIGIRSTYLSSSKGNSRCINVSNYINKDETDFSKSKTLVKLKNVTFLNDSNDITGDIQQGLIKEAIYVGESTSIDATKTVISGFNPAVVIDKKTVINKDNLDKIKLTEMYFNLCNGNIFSEGNPDNGDIESWFGAALFKNYYAKSSNKETFIMPSGNNPDYRLQIDKISESLKN